MTAQAWCWVLMGAIFGWYARWALRASRCANRVAVLERRVEQLLDQADEVVTLHTLIVAPEDLEDDSVLWDEIILCFLKGEDVQLCLPADTLARLR
jgi:hypothetical protein